MIFNETALGFEAALDQFFLFFGKKDANLQSLPSAYPEFQWARVRQTHSDLILESKVESSTELQEADAHYSSENRLALLISTADCIPAFVVDSRLGIAATIHAGWRGVAQRIIPKTIEQLISKGSSQKDLSVIVGPHISFASFEIGAETKDQLIQSVKSKFPPEFIKDLGAGKSLLDLRALAHLQIQEFGIQKIHDLSLDTKTDLRFHSHRRDREMAGRQLSFCALKS